MGSRRRLLLAAAVTLLAAMPAVPAAATPADDPRAVADRFSNALVHEDSETFCSLLTPRALERFGGPDRCRRAFRDERSAADAAAQSTLGRAYAAARTSARLRNGRFVTKRFGVAKLAREMERIEPELTVVVGKGPAAASGRLVTTVVLDRRTTARRLVAYVESDDGSIWRLSATVDGSADLDEVAQGVPETTNPPPAPPETAITFAIQSVNALADGRVLVDVKFSYEEDGEQATYAFVLVLVPVGGTYLVDDILVSVLSDA